MGPVKKQEIMNMTKELLYKYFRRETTPDEELEIDSWLGESPDNLKLYKKASDEYELLVMTADLDSIKGSDRGRSTRQAEAPAGKKRTRTVIRIVLDAAAAAAIFFIASWISDYRVEKELSDELVSVTALPGQIMSTTLADGTVITLNSGSTLSYPALFRGKERVVRLEGEAYFDVEHDEDQPFIVKTFASDIRVLGTEFNVDAEKDKGNFSVTLVEGAIKVTDANDPAREMIMKPGDKVFLRAGRLEKEEVEAKDEIRWKDGIIDIGGLDFAQLMDKLEMAFGVKIVIDRETMPQLMFTDGRLRVSDGIEYALRVLQDGADFTWKKDFRTGTIYIR